MNHLFVNNIRFLSMAAIIAVHAEKMPFNFTDNVLNTVLVQILKFGTICFFLISGFLLGSKITETDAATYLRKRADATLLPWVFWACVFLPLLLLKPWQQQTLGVQTVVDRITEVLFYTNYWFVPNFLLALGILLLFKKFFSALWFGFLLLCGSLFYGANIYLQWMPTEHTAALLGFVFYLWLGVQLHLRLAAIRQVIDRVNWAWLGLALMGTLALSLLEAQTIGRYNSDILNTLRVSNQLYSLVCFAALLKVHVPLSPAWMNVRTQTFGLYLIHAVPLFVFSNLLALALPNIGSGGDIATASDLPASLSTPYQRFTFWLLMFGLVYSSSWLATRLISGTRFARLVGVKQGEPARGPRLTGAPAERDRNVKRDVEEQSTVIGD